MARFQCRACGYDDQAVWSGELICPRCNSAEGVRAAIAVEEMTEHDVALFAAAFEDVTAEGNEA